VAFLAGATTDCGLGSDVGVSLCADVRTTFSDRVTTVAFCSWCCGVDKGLAVACVSRCRRAKLKRGGDNNDCWWWRLASRYCRWRVYYGILSVVMRWTQEIKVLVVALLLGATK